jgi:hypothetical protein
VRAHLCSELIGATVVDQNGRKLGRVFDLTVEAPAAGRTRVGSLPVTTLLYGRRRLGGSLGYRTDWRQGPWIVAAPMRAWHRADRLLLLEDVEELRWESGEVVVRESKPTVSRSP